MYRALVDRDPAFEGLFVAAIKTTGIFCRPTCTARKPNRENVEFFTGAQQAMLAGYRACKRCKPLEPANATPDWARSLMQRVEQSPQQRVTSQDLRRMKIDPARASRWFKQHHGMTFQAWHRARRMGLALHEVRNGTSVDRTALRHGYESSNGFREAFGKLFGVPPREGEDIKCMTAKWIDTPLGAMLAVADDDGLALLEFVDRRMLQTQIATLRRRFSATIVPGEHRTLTQTARELEKYFKGKLKRFETPLALRGTAFQERVWKRLMAIPYGEALSYAEMAIDLGERGAQRAVGKANGDNRLAIIIPCHRVIKADGTLCGYGGGLWRKQWLLDHERQTARH